MSTLVAHHLLGTADDGDLILLAGPDYERILQLVRASGIPYLEWHEAGDVEALQAKVVQRGESIVVIASMCEVEGLLDRSAFDRHLTDLAYTADRVVYAGMDGAVPVHPALGGAVQEVRNGHFVARTLMVAAS